MIASLQGQTNVDSSKQLTAGFCTEPSAFRASSGDDDGSGSGCRIVIDFCWCQVQTLQTIVIMVQVVPDDRMTTQMTAETKEQSIIVQSNKAENEKKKQMSFVMATSHAPNHSLKLQLIYCSPVPNGQNSLPQYLILVTQEVQYAGFLLMPKQTS